MYNWQVKLFFLVAQGMVAYALKRKSNVLLPAQPQPTRLLGSLLSTVFVATGEWVHGTSSILKVDTAQWLRAFYGPGFGAPTDLRISRSGSRLCQMSRAYVLCRSWSEVLSGRYPAQEILRIEGALARWREVRLVPEGIPKSVEISCADCANF